MVDPDMVVGYPLGENRYRVNNRGTALGLDLRKYSIISHRVDHNGCEAHYSKQIEGTPRFESVGVEPGNVDSTQEAIRLL